MSTQPARGLPRVPRTLQVDKVWIETDWEPGNNWLQAKVRCLKCGDMMTDLDAWIAAIDATDVELEGDSLTIGKQCRCGMYHRGTITVNPGYPPKNGLSRRWECKGCRQTGHPTYFGSINAVKGRVYLRCCGVDWTFRARDVVRDITGRRVGWVLPF